MKRYKFPSIPHLPWSATIQKDDQENKNIDSFLGKRIYITEKLDGENTTIYSDGYIHARSIDSKNHPSRNWVKNMASKLDIPNGYRICGENLYAKHSIFYDNLTSYFQVFAIWKEDVCLSVYEMIRFCTEIDLFTTPLIFSGQFFDEKEFLDWHKNYIKTSDLNKTEGYVVRLEKSFTINDFSNCIAKFVRPNHVQTDEHWMSKDIIKNKMRR